MKAKIHVIAVAYERFGELKVFIQSLINQTSTDWCLTVLHDGPNEQFDLIMESYAQIVPNKIEFFPSEIRFNDYGHSLRDLGLKKIKGDYVLLTNADNYYIPKAVEYLVLAVKETNADVVLFDMIHSHNHPGGRPLPPYSFFETTYKRGSIDIGSAIVKKKLAEKVGFRDKTHDGDATYFEMIASEKLNLIIAKISRVLLVHN